MSTTNEPGNQVATVKPQISALSNMLAADSVQAQFKNALGENAPSFIASLMELFSGDSYLQNCQPGAVIQQALKAATLKLPIIKALGFAYIIPYNKNSKQGDQWVTVAVPQFQMGYKGYIQLAIRTNQYKTINAEEVYQGEYRTKNKLTGEFDLNGIATSETVIGYFAHFELLNGFSKTLYMTKEKILAHANKYSKSIKEKNSPWNTEFDAMAKKTVLTLLLSKYGVLSVEMAAAYKHDIDDDIQDEIRNFGNGKEFTDFEDQPGAGSFATTPPSQGGTGPEKVMDFEQKDNNNGRRPF